MENNQNIPNEYKPISAWGYFGYNLLFAIPLIGFICLIIFAFDNSNINRKNYARSFFCGFILLGIIVLIAVALFTVGGVSHNIMGISVPQ